MSIHLNLTGVLSLDGKVVVTTGASSGIGRGNAQRFAEPKQAPWCWFSTPKKREGGRAPPQEILATGGKAASQRYDVYAVGCSKPVTNLQPRR